MSRKITVVFSSQPDFGGGFQYSHCVWEALKTLDNDVWAVDVICLSAVWEAKVRQDGFPAVLQSDNGWGRMAWRICKRLPRGVSLWRRVARHISPLMRAVHARPTDLVIFPCESYRSLGTTLPTLAPVHDLMYIYERRFSEVGAWSKFWQRALVDRNVCRHARGILVDSVKGREQLIESYSVQPEHVYVLPYIAPPQVMGKSQNMLEVPFERFIFYPAQLWEHKNHQAILRAMALLRDKGLVVNAIFCGSKKDGAAGVLASIAQLDLARQVAYLGYVDAAFIGKLYDRAVALVMPTFFGPTNIPPLEAFTRGCPVAVSNIYGMPEQMGDAALLFDPCDDGQIAAVIERLWTSEELRKEMASRGRKRIEYLNQATFNRRFAEILNKCTEE